MEGFRYWATVFQCFSVMVFQCFSVSVFQCDGVSVFQCDSEWKGSDTGPQCFSVIVSGSVTGPQCFSVMVSGMNWRSLEQRAAQQGTYPAYQKPPVPHREADLDRI